MMRVAHKWIVGVVAALFVLPIARDAIAADVTDADRSFRNYTQETAVVSDQQIRLEVRGVWLENEKKTRTNLIGFRIKADTLNGGIFSLVGSYGLAKNAEVGFIVPGYIESRRTAGQPTDNREDMGDVQLYGKFKYSVAEHCAVGGGVQLNMPTGNEKKEFGTGELGMRPFVSTRYEHGTVGVGAQLGYEFFRGDVPDVFHYGGEAILRASDTWALRAEIGGRIFQQGGFRNHDVSFYPGIDFHLSENLIIRPVGVIGLSRIAVGRGVGVGLVATF